MDVAIAGGHGAIALRLLGLLAERGDRGRGLIRNPDHAADLEAIGAEPVLCDLEQLDDISSCVEGADAVVFAAGAGPGSGAERKKTVDLGGAVKLIDAAKKNGIDRYLIVSAIGATNPERATPQMRPYYDAKAGADRAVEESGLAYTIVRPGLLTDEPGAGLVELAPHLDRSGDIPRADVAAVLLAVLDTPRTARKDFDLLSGETPIEEAVRSL